jgi:hypothetical protein
VLEPLMGHVIEPLVYGQSTGLSPFAVVVSAIFWTWLWGPIGLLIATPLTVCLVVLGRHVERLEFLDVLLGDRPALTPIENFYQRMLAGDPDEAMEHAELLLKERSLSSYYDEVSLKGLQLAANDAARGVLTPAQLGRIKNAVLGLVRDLADHDDADPVLSKAKQKEKDAEEGPAGPTAAERDLPIQPAVVENAPEPRHLPPEWRVEHPVMCIAGRGPARRGGLRHAGAASRPSTSSARASSRTRRCRAPTSSASDVTGVRWCASPTSRSAAARRICATSSSACAKNCPRRRSWSGSGRRTTSSTATRPCARRSAPDYYVTSLREAVDACCKAAYAASDLPPAEETQEPAEPAPTRPAVAAE